MFECLMLFYNYSKEVRIMRYRKLLAILLLIGSVLNLVGDVMKLVFLKEWDDVTFRRTIT